MSPKKIPRDLINDYLKPQLVKMMVVQSPVSKSIDESLGSLFQDVQLSRLYADGKTFVDMVPTKRIKRIVEEYELERRSQDFNLSEFVARHFYAYEEPGKLSYTSNPEHTVLEHIDTLWNVLSRSTRKDKGTLFSLPYTYITPGGRFQEQFYWDSYFIMLGLAASDKFSLIEGMMKNYTHMIRKYGFIPTANRSYFLSRSQPPFFSHMIELIGARKGRRTALITYLPYLLAEYRFWMKSDRAFKAKKVTSYRRVVRIDNDIVMNRYYDNNRSPRPESYQEDVHTLYKAPPQHASRVYLDLRAAAESGWDFSSRWFRKQDDISTIHTTDILPIDLNCLLYHMESLIAETYTALFQPLFARQFKKLAENRKKTINEYFWSEEKKCYFDYDFVRRSHTNSLTAAAIFPLYVGIASPHQAKLVAETVQDQLLKAGGVQASTVDNGQQWDAPNGWAPLQWIAIQAFRRYGYSDLADEIKSRWIATNIQVYSTERKLVEKYNVRASHQAAGGGEYPLQDGFGWTNGVLQALMLEDVDGLS